MGSRTYPLVDRIVDGRLESLLREWRADGLSHEAIARRLAVDFDVDVTGETVRVWWTELGAAS